MLQIDGQYIKDEEGRVLFLRGVNLSGNIKNPFKPYLSTHSSRFADFFDHRSVSFVGRPFPLEEADTHFARLRRWGLTFLRYLVTWEALEHKGPGQYDYEYIEYVVEILKRAKVHGIKVFIDPHQDAFSRFTGGSGAPGWVVESVGFDVRNMAASEAALIQNFIEPPTAYPRMIWPTNLHKLGCATMFTMFFGGKVFADKIFVDGKNIQDYLQDHFFGAIKELIKAIMSADLHDNTVVGYDTLNEPSAGYLGWSDLLGYGQDQDLKYGSQTTGFQGMLLGEGIPTLIEEYHFGAFGPQKKGARLANPDGIRAWRDGIPCVWARQGVWDVKSKQLLKPNYFERDPRNGRRVNFLRDFWKPYVNKFAQEIRKVHKTAIIFIEPCINDYPPAFEKTDNTERSVLAPHWYDGKTMLSQKFHPWTIDYIGVARGKLKNVFEGLAIGRYAISQNFTRQIRDLRDENQKRSGGLPVLFGENGIPFDLDGKQAYKDGDYSNQANVMDINIKAFEENLLHFTLWVYNADNNFAWGDQWNKEDLSIFSVGHVLNPYAKTRTTSFVDHGYFRSPDGIIDIAQKENPRFRPIDYGGRAVESFCRPYPLKTFGIPVSIKFDLKTRFFKYVFTNNTSIPKAGSETVIFLPEIHYGSDESEIVVIVSDGSYRFDFENQYLIYVHDDLQRPDHFIIIQSKEFFDQTCWKKCKCSVQ